MKAILYFCPVLAGICWGSTGMFVRTLSQAGFDNLTITFSRSAVCCIIIVLLILLKNGRGCVEKLKINPKDLPFFISYSVSGCLLMNLCYNYALNMLSMSFASVLLSLCPFFVLVFSRFLFNEKITGVKILCLITAVAGCVLLSGISEKNDTEWNFIGMCFGLGSAVFYALFTVHSKQLSVKNYDTITISLYFFLITTILLVPFAEWECMGTFTASDPVKSILFYILHAVVVSFLPNYLFNWSMTRMDSGKISILSGGAEPAAALLFGAVFYSEPVSVHGLAGLALVIAAISLLIKFEKADNK
ncbi:MAG: EamA family transporter [Firmicutes bacterium]|nr:EamA family transporter [Bacillota bacterium]